MIPGAAQYTSQTAQVAPFRDVVTGQRLPESGLSTVSVGYVASDLAVNLQDRGVIGPSAPLPDFEHTSTCQYVVRFRNSPFSRPATVSNMGDGTSISFDICKNIPALHLIAECNLGDTCYANRMVPLQRRGG